MIPAHDRGPVPRVSRSRQVERALRRGKVLVLLAVLLPTLFLFLGLVIDGSLMLMEARDGRHVTDSAACASAWALSTGNGDPQVVGPEFVQVRNGLATAAVTVHVPPSTGAFVGRDGYVEVIAKSPYLTKFPRVAGLGGPFELYLRSVAGTEPATAGAAIVLLDPSPAPLSIAAVPLVLPSLPSLVAGLEVLGLGTVRVDGAILSNNEWGGVDEHGDPVGTTTPLLGPHAIACTPLLPLTRVHCRDLWVVGGIDNPLCYRDLDDLSKTAVKANRHPVSDPYASLPVPTTSSDPVNVNAALRGGVSVVSLPLLPPVTLRPGVYDWIEIVSGRVNFEPGVYVIRGVNPVTRIGLNMLAANVQARGVMFYITNGSSFSATTGLPDAADGDTAPAPAVTTLAPSAVVNVGLLGSRFSGLDSPGSPFNGLLLYQRRTDRRPVLFVQTNLSSSAPVAGNVYARWGHVLLAGIGRYESAFVCGTMRILDALDCRIEPPDLLPPATDVFLVE